jgi:hypothetical protein
MLKEELPLSVLVERNIGNYFFNLISYTEDSFVASKSIFVPSITNFYITDTISQNSSIMGECSLFLNENTNI